jgi:UDP-N-acetylglucosamine 2-epimerase (non-hydrolysing)
MTITIILGTRPEIIKMAPVIRECERRSLDYNVLHTGQHYSYQMDKVFFEQLELPEPEFNLDVGSGNHGEQTGKILAGVEKVLMAERPEVVLVQGDTNTVMAGALAASKLHIKVGHVEAGLRSYDRNMPEEINRVVADHISDYCFAPTNNARNNLLAEGIADDKISVTGNTIVDSVYQNLEIARKKVSALDDLGLSSRGYFLATLHRAENVDDKFRLKEILQGLKRIAKDFSLPVVFPVHPRTRKMVQEETCILGVPCVTLRDNTERPETLEVRSNMLAGADALRMVLKVKRMLEQGNGWKNPFGDGRAGSAIINHLY